MKLDIRSRDMSKPLTFKQLWLAEQMKRINMNSKLSKIPVEKIRDYLLKKYDERRLSMGRLYNNADQKNVQMTQEQFINEFLNKRLHSVWIYGIL